MTSVCEKAKYYYIKTLRKLLKLWRINIGIPVLIIQILKIFGLNLNIRLYNPPILSHNHPIKASKSSNLGFVNPPIFAKFPSVNPPNFSFTGLLILQFKICKSSDLGVVNHPILTADQPRCDNPPNFLLLGLHVLQIGIVNPPILSNVRGLP